MRPSAKLLPTAVFLVLLMIMAGIAFLCHRHTSSLHETRAGISQAHQVIEILDELRLRLTAAEGSRRGYALTGDERGLQSYRRNVDVVRKAGATLRQLTRDNPSQQARFDKLDPLIEERL